MVIASRRHWRILVSVIAALVAAAFVLPRVAPAPDLRENRSLAAQPRGPQGWAEVRSFREATDAYVSDRFPARAHLIAFLNRLRMMAGVSGSSRVIVGRQGWLFFDDDTHLGAARNAPPMSGPQLRQWLSALAIRSTVGLQPQVRPGLRAKSA